MTSSEQAGCQARTSSGDPCKARPRPGTQWCPFHDPTRAEDQAEARRKGGRVRSRPPAVLEGAEDLPCATVGDARALIARTINDVRTGRLDPRVGNCIGVLAGVLLRALESDDLAARLAELQRQLDEVRGHEPGSDEATSGPAGSEVGNHAAAASGTTGLHGTRSPAPA